LRYRGDDGTGWSLAWKTNLWARFKDGDHTLMMASKLLSSAEEEFGTGEKGGVYKNLFDAHPPFQIDGNFGGAAGIAEMLLQSHLGYLEILPALPKLLPSGSIKGLVARGGFEVSMVWKAGVLDKLVIFSKVGADCKLVYGNKQTSFSTKKGAQYVLDKDLKVQ
jgi:alpha-L-fucosidase 2